MGDNVKGQTGIGTFTILEVKGDVGYHFSDVMLIGADVAYKSAFYDCATRVGSFACEIDVALQVVGVFCKVAIAKFKFTICFIEWI